MQHFQDDFDWFSVLDACNWTSEEGKKADSNESKMKAVGQKVQATKKQKRPSKAEVCSILDILGKDLDAVIKQSKCKSKMPPTKKQTSQKERKRDSLMDSLSAAKRDIGRIGSAKTAEMTLGTTIQ